jgi:hypothetical protein
VGLFSNGNFYPNLRASDIVTAPEGASEEQRMAAADKTVENVKAHMKENLRVLWNESGATGQENNKVWYDGARNIVNDQVAEYGLNDASVAGVYAALSPQKDWDQNVYLGDAVLDIYQNKQDHPWNAEMAATAKEIWTKPRQQKILPNVIGRSLAECEGPTEKAMWIRTYDQTYSERQFRSVNADGTRGDVVRNLDGTPTTAAWPPLPMISNAVKSIEANGDPARLSEAMGTQHKVRSFFNNILDPNSQNGDVTIDTHAVGAALLRPVGNSHVTYIQASAGSLERKKQPEGYQAASGSVETGSYGLYPIYADAVRELATDLGVQPRQLQSVTWEMKRALFPRTTTDQQKLQVEAAWHAYREDPSITLADTQARILEIARRRS